MLNSGYPPKVKALVLRYLAEGRSPTWIMVNTGVPRQRIWAWKRQQKELRAT